jgi:hypothetical protein
MHRLTVTREKEIQLEPTVDRILDLHLRFGKRYLNVESPKSVCATKDNRDTHSQPNRGLYMQRMNGTHLPRPLYT